MQAYGQDTTPSRHALVRLEKAPQRVEAARSLSVAEWEARTRDARALRPEELRVLDAASVRAVAGLTRTLSEFNAYLAGTGALGPQTHRALTRWFGIGLDRAWMRRQNRGLLRQLVHELAGIRRALQRFSEDNFRIDPTPGPALGGIYTRAYVNPFDRAEQVYVAPGAVQRKNLDTGVIINLSQMLIHEVSHFESTASALDLGYGIRACERLAEQATGVSGRARALSNAESLSYFVSDLNWNEFRPSRHPR